MYQATETSQYFNHNVVINDVVLLHYHFGIASFSLDTATVELT